MVGRTLLCVLLGLSLWTVAGRAVESVLPSPVATAATAACVDGPLHDDTEHRAWTVLHANTAPPGGPDWKSQPRVGAFGVAPAAGSSRPTHPELARPAPAPAAFAHLHAIPLLI